jgi:CheY-like chemotaxis protein
LAPDLRWTTADAAQVQTAILNLALNGRDAMPDGGRLMIATQNLPRDARLRADLPPGEYVSVVMTDTGEGMAPDVLARAFEPFFTTKDIGKGTGLGLSMVYSTMRQMGGEIEIDSRPGEGTTVRLILPVAPLPDPDSAIEPEAAPAARLPKAEPSTILYVEDDALVSLATSDLLEEAGYSLHTAPDAMRALAVLEEHPEIGLMVTDVGLPGMDGHALAAEARRLRPDLKLLFLSGYDRGRAIGEFADARTEHLGKPYAESDLLEALRRLSNAGEPDVDRKIDDPAGGSRPTTG